MSATFIVVICICSWIAMSGSSLCPSSDNNTFVVEGNNTVYHLDNCTAAGLRLVVPSYSANATVTVSNAHFAAPAGAASSVVDWVVMCPTTNLSLVIDGVVFDGISLSFPLVSDGSIADCRHTLLRLTVRNTVQLNFSHPSDRSAWIDVKAPATASVVSVANVRASTFQQGRVLIMNGLQHSELFLMSSVLFFSTNIDSQVAMHILDCQQSNVTLSNVSTQNTLKQMEGVILLLWVLNESTLVVTNFSASYGRTVFYFQRLTAASNILIHRAQSTLYGQIVEFDVDVSETSIRLESCITIYAKNSLISIFASRRFENTLLQVMDCDIDNGAYVPGYPSTFAVQLSYSGADQIVMDGVVIAFLNVFANISSQAINTYLNSVAVLRNTFVSFYRCTFPQKAGYLSVSLSKLENVTVQCVSMAISTMFFQSSTVNGFLVRYVGAPSLCEGSLVVLNSTSTSAAVTVEVIGTLGFFTAGRALAVVTQGSSLFLLCVRFVAVVRAILSAPLVYFLSGTTVQSTSLEVNDCGSVYLNYYWLNATSAPPNSGIARTRLVTQNSVLVLLYSITALVCHMADALCTVCITSSTINSSSAVLVDMRLCSPAAHYTLSSTAINGGSTSVAVIVYDSGTIGGLATSVTLLRCRVVGFVTVAATSPLPCNLPPPAPGASNTTRFACLDCYMSDAERGEMIKVGPPGNLFGLPLSLASFRHTIPSSCLSLSFDSVSQTSTNVSNSAVISSSFLSGDRSSTLSNTGATSPSLSISGGTLALLPSVVKLATLQSRAVAVIAISSAAVAALSLDFAHPSNGLLMVRLGESSRLVMSRRCGEAANGEADEVLTNVMDNPLGLCLGALPEGLRCSTGALLDNAALAVVLWLLACFVDTAVRAVELSRVGGQWDVGVMLRGARLAPTWVACVSLFLQPVVTAAAVNVSAGGRSWPLAALSCALVCLLAAPTLRIAVGGVRLAFAFREQGAVVQIPPSLDQSIAVWLRWWKWLTDRQHSLPLKVPLDESLFSFEEYRSPRCVAFLLFDVVWTIACALIVGVGYSSIATCSVAQALTWSLFTAGACRAAVTLAVRPMSSRGGNCELCFFSCAGSLSILCSCLSTDTGVVELVLWYSQVTLLGVKGLLSISRHAWWAYGWIRREVRSDSLPTIVHCDVVESHHEGQEICDTHLPIEAVTSTCRSTVNRRLLRRALRQRVTFEAADWPLSDRERCDRLRRIIDAVCIAHRR